MTPSDLTPDELDRAHATLRRRFVGGQYPNVTAVTLGTALRGGRIDPQRTWAVCFHVARKVTPTRKARRIPPTVTIRVRRGGGYAVLKDLPTDVIDMSGVRPTGVGLLTPKVAGPAEATGGLLLAWQVVGGVTQEPRAGLVTVGHACSQPADLGPFRRWVFIPGDGGLTHFLLDRTAVEADGVDASVVLLNGSSTAGQGGATFPLRSRDAVAGDFGQPGRSLRADASPADPFPFVVTSPILPTFPIPSLGDQADVVRVQATGTHPEPFREGTSGSVWVIDHPQDGSQAAMIQLAADLATFTTGYGQVIQDTSLAWAVGVITAQPGFVPGSLVVVGGF